jgi:hypothetical protein
MIRDVSAPCFVDGACDAPFPEAAWGFPLHKPYFSRAVGEESLSEIETQARVRPQTATFAGVTRKTYTTEAAAQVGQQIFYSSGELFSFASRARCARLATRLAGASWSTPLHPFNITATIRRIETLESVWSFRETPFYTWQKN